MYIYEPNGQFMEPEDFSPETTRAWLLPHTHRNMGEAQTMPVDMQGSSKFGGSLSYQYVSLVLSESLIFNC